MVKVTTDIDIDFADRDTALATLPHIPASMGEHDRRRHPSGVYFQDVPVDPYDGFCALPYDQAAESGYFKIDFLNNTLYQGVRDEDHLDALIAQEPDWDLFTSPEIVGVLPHIHDHFGIVQAIRPQSIEDLAVILALIRPGKRHLMGKPRPVIDAEIWSNGDGYTFKRAHAIAYAMTIILRLNLICEETARALEQQNA